MTSAGTERQKRSQNLAPVLVIISGNSLVFSRKMITSTGFSQCCAPSASAVCAAFLTPIHGLFSDIVFNEQSTKINRGGMFHALRCSIRHGNQRH